MLVTHRINPVFAVILIAIASVFSVVLILHAIATVNFAGLAATEAVG